LIVSMSLITEASINLQVNATGTGDANTGAVTSTTAISSPKTTVAHAVVDATVTPLIQTAVAYKKMAEETQRLSIPQDVLSVNAGTMTSESKTQVAKDVMYTPRTQNDADIGMTKTSCQLKYAVPAVEDVIVTQLTFSTVVALTRVLTSAIFQHAPLRKEICRSTTSRTVSIHLSNVISMTTSQTSILASTLQT